MTGAALATEALIEFRQVSHRFAARPVLSDINLAVRPSEFVCMVGPSGCGKTTMLRMAAGLLRPERGAVFYSGALVTEPAHAVAFMFQDYSKALLPWRNAAGNVALALEASGVPRAERQPRIAALLEKVGLGGHAEQFPLQLSGGMQQRLQIARCLAQEPSVLLMDEPFGALDAMTRESMNLELQKIWLTSAKTILFITHGIQEAVFLGDRVLVMSPRPGKIVADIRVEEGRPRSFAFMESARFGQLTARVREHIMSKGAIE
ncbi:MAG: ABC transporter ATP-binding protein [Stellaceae bacterium]